MSITVSSLELGAVRTDSHVPRTLAGKNVLLIRVGLGVDDGHAVSGAEGCDRLSRIPFLLAAAARATPGTSNLIFLMIFQALVSAASEEARAQALNICEA
jgi:hypothetical protein